MAAVGCSSMHLKELNVLVSCAFILFRYYALNCKLYANPMKSMRYAGTGNGHRSEGRIRKSAGTIITGLIPGIGMRPGDMERAANWAGRYVEDVGANFCISWRKKFLH
jgi:hypothetical protein